jgi:hypothetical protein
MSASIFELKDRARGSFSMILEVAHIGWELLKRK